VHDLPQIGNGYDGYSNIFGVAESSLANVIKAYRNKRLPNAVMQNIAGRLTDDEIAALALYFSKTPKP
jgi:cytochrome c553